MLEGIRNVTLVRVVTEQDARDQLAHPAEMVSAPIIPRRFGLDTRHAMHVACTARTCTGRNQTLGSTSLYQEYGFFHFFQALEDEVNAVCNFHVKVCMRCEIKCENAHSKYKLD
eukprot:1232888-Rhodomonas_salina.2